jgi:hypothetical protein
MDLAVGRIDASLSYNTIGNHESGPFGATWGRLVYAGVPFHLENEDVVAAGGKKRWRMIRILPRWEPWAFSAPHQAGTAPLSETLPHRHDSDGFFVARWKRADAFQMKSRTVLLLSSLERFDGNLT